MKRNTFNYYLLMHDSNKLLIIWIKKIRFLSINFDIANIKYLMSIISKIDSLE